MEIRDGFPFQITSRTRALQENFMIGCSLKRDTSKPTSLVDVLKRRRLPTDAKFGSGVSSPYISATRSFDR
jgi:hypothetical protein